MNEEQKRVSRWYLVLLAAAVLASVTKIFIGVDQDEAYIVTMAVRLLNGNRIFDDMWELHMTSAWPAYLGLLFYRGMTGTLEGGILFLRFLSVVLQSLVALTAYRILNRYHDRNVAMLTGLAVVSFLPRATQNLEYGLLEMLFVLLSVLLLYEELMRREGGEAKSAVRVICAGILYALGVLAYPTIVISFPVLLTALVFLQKKEPGRWKLPLIFAGACGFCAVLFCVYIFSYLTPAELIENIQGILADGMHSDIGKTQTYLLQLLELLKRTGMIALAAGICYAVFYKWEKRKSLFFYYLLLAGAMIFVGFNVTGLRPSGPIGLQIRYILAALAAIFFAIKMKAGKLAGLFLIPGWAIYAGAMLGSNMGFEENASFLYLAVFAAVMLMTAYARKQGGQYCRIGLFCAGCFVFSIIFSKGYLVRVTGTGPANIMEQRVQMESGLRRGIYVYPQEAETYAGKEAEVRKYSTQDDVILYLGNDALCNTFTEGEFTSATCISTPIYNEEWVKYYENEKHPQPTVLFLDKDMMADWESFAGTEFGTYLIERYEITASDIVEEEAFYIVRISENI